MRVAVIGAGASGLPAIKCCLEEGLDVVCFEQRPYIGGLWHYEEQVRDGWSSVMWTTVTNNNKEIMMYSDFPHPKESPAYLPHFRCLEYLQMYADHFKLMEHIRFEVEVITVNQLADDHVESFGRWELTVKQSSTGEMSQESFDAVMICSGHDRYKLIPHVQGETDFEGVILHSHDYRTNDSFRDKTVVVVGSGNSAVDVATDFSNVSKQVYLSSRHGAWILKRVWDNSLPWEVSVFTRLKFAIISRLPHFLALRVMRSAFGAHLDHAQYGILPDYDVGRQVPSVSDALPSRLINGTVLMRPGIRRLMTHGVEFIDGSTLNGVDVIIFATGYNYDAFQFVDHDGFKLKNGNKPQLFNLIFPPSISPPTAAMIGLVDTKGSLLAASELQSRYAVRVFKGLIELPDATTMQRTIDEDNKTSETSYAVTNRQYILREPIPYFDRLAKAIGCKPPGFLHLLFTDPRLAKAVYFGLSTNVQYRLVGPGAWIGARDVILGTRERLLYPLSAGRPISRKSDKKSPNAAGSRLLFVALVATVSTSAAAVCGWCLKLARAQP